MPHKYLTNTGSYLFWGEFRPSRKFSNTFDVKIPHSGHVSRNKQFVSYVLNDDLCFYDMDYVPKKGLCLSDLANHVYSLNPPGL